MQGSADFIERMVPVEMFPEKIFLRAEQQVIVALVAFEDIVSGVVDAARLRRQLPLGRRRSLGPETQIRLVTFDFVNLETGFARPPR